MSSRARRLVPLALAAALLAAAPGAGDAAGAGAGAGEWAAAAGERSWSFPRDHGAHPAYRTEWWYFTGLLADASGGRYGYQLTFFRQGIRPAPADPGNPWSVRDLHLAHFAVTDVGRGRFRYAERASRSGPGLAGAGEGGLRAWVLGWSATASGDAIELEARDGAIHARLTLRPRGAPVLHGRGGLSAKGSLPGEASWYASVTDLETAGTLSPGEGAPEVAVRGASWFDHEFGSGELPADAAGWDWLGLRLSGGRALMLYRLRRADGSGSPASAGTFVGADGSATPLAAGDFTFTAAGSWTSPASGARYPARWRVGVPRLGLTVELAPLVADGELRTGRSTGVTYWEGPVTGAGSAAGAPISAEGYVELTGYAAPMRALF